MIWVLFLVLVGNAEPAAEEVEPGLVEFPNAELGAYIDEALANHPRVAQRQSEYEAAFERIAQVKSLENPKLTYGQFLQSETTRAKVGLSQHFPWFGTLEARGNRAAAEARAAAMRVEAARNAVRYSVEEAYYAYAFLRERLDVLRSQAAVLAYIEDVIEAKLALGLADEDELLRVSMESTELEDEIRRLVELRPAMAAQLAAALGRMSPDNLDWPEPLGLPSEPPPAPIVAARIKAANPELLALAEREHAFVEAERAARKAGWPDFTLSLEWTGVSKPRKNRPDRPYPATLNAASRLLSVAAGNTNLVPRNAAIDAYALATTREPMAYSNGGEDNVMVAITVGLPIWRKKVNAGVAEAQRRQSALRHEASAAFLELDSRARMVRYEATDASKRLSLYRDSLLPQAERTYESLLGKYSVGAPGKSLTGVLDVLEEWLSFQIEAARARRDWRRANAELAFLMAGD